MAPSWSMVYSGYAVVLDEGPILRAVPMVLILDIGSMRPSQYARPTLA